MIIVTYDGRHIECIRVEFANDGKRILYDGHDGWQTIPIIEVLRIIRNPHI